MSGEELICLESLDLCVEVSPASSHRAPSSRHVLQSLLVEESRYAVAPWLANNIMSRNNMEILYGWMCAVCVSREEDVSSIASNVCNRFMGRYCDQIDSEHLLQLIGAASIHLASKLLESDPMTLDLVVFCTDHSYTAEAINMMELIMLSTLRFDICSVPPGQFLEPLMRLLQVPEENREILRRDATRRISLSLIDAQLALCRCSVLAGACLVSSMKSLGFPVSGSFVEKLCMLINSDKVEITKVCEISDVTVAKHWAEIYDQTSETVDVGMQRQDSLGYGTMDEDDSDNDEEESGRESADCMEDSGFMDEYVENSEPKARETSRCGYLIDCDSGIQDDMDVMSAPYPVAVSDCFSDSD